MDKKVAAVRYPFEDKGIWLELTKYCSPNNLSDNSLIELVAIMMDHVERRLIDTLPAVKHALYIIKNDYRRTFITSLLNTCHQRYHVLRRIGPSSIEYCTIVQFLLILYCELKCSKLQSKIHYKGVPLNQVLLKLLITCCQDCLKVPNSEAEMDTLSYILTSIGHEMEQELPAKLDQLISYMRDAFLIANASPAIKKTLLYLIELYASKWRLPDSAVTYYTTNI